MLLRGKRACLPACQGRKRRFPSSMQGIADLPLKVGVAVLYPLHLVKGAWLERQRDSTKVMIVRLVFSSDRIGENRFTVRWQLREGGSEISEVVCFVRFTGLRLYRPSKNSRAWRSQKSETS